MVKLIIIFINLLLIALTPTKVGAHFGVQDEMVSASVGGIHPTLLLAVVLAVFILGTITVQLMKRRK